MKGLGDTDIKILTTLKENPHGLFLWQIQKYVGIELRQYAYYFIRKLQKRGLVIQREKLWFASPQVQSGELIILHKPITQAKQKMQRPHALQYNAQLHKTSADRAASTLTSLAIPFKQRQGIISFNYKGLNMKITSKCKLIAYPHIAEQDINLPIASIKELAALALAQQIEDFLSFTGLRARRTREGDLFLLCRYWENGMPDNEIDNEVHQQTGEEFIVYAIDRLTGKPRIWGDGSPNPLRELETNSERADKVLKEMFQAVEDGELNPYKDTMDIRKELSTLQERQRIQDESSAIIQQMLSRLLQRRPEQPSQAPQQGPSMRWN